MKQEITKGRSARDIAEKKKKQKKRRRRKDDAAILLNDTDSQRPFKRSRRSKARQTSEIPSREALSEKEKQSLRAWVEKLMKPQNLHGDTEAEVLAGRISVERSSMGHIDNLSVCVGNDLSAPFCNGGTHAASLDNGTCDLLPPTQAFGADPRSHGYGEKPLSNGLKCQANHHLQNRSAKDLNVQSSQEEGLAHAAAENYEEAQLVKLVNASSLKKGQSSVAPSGEVSVACHSSHSSSLMKGNPLNCKRKREDDKVLQYILKRNIVIHPSLSEPSPKRSRTAKSVVDAWGRLIPVTLTSEAHTVEEWISSQNGDLFGLDVEWRPNRARGEKNKVALLQLCNESECLIIQMLFLNQKPPALCKLLSDPTKSLAGVGVLADGKRLLHDYGLECQGSIELTTLAVERLKRDELRNVGLKVLMQEVLGLKMNKPKRVTLSNWAKAELDRAQVDYACMDAWASFALLQKLLVDM